MYIKFFKLHHFQKITVVNFIEWITILKLFKKKKLKQYKRGQKLFAFEYEYT